MDDCPDCCVPGRLQLSQPGQELRLARPYVIWTMKSLPRVVKGGDMGHMTLLLRVAHCLEEWSWTFEMRRLEIQLAAEFIFCQEEGCGRGKVAPLCM